MPDLSSEIANAILAGHGFGLDPDAMRDAILARWPAATGDEIERGYQIAAEMRGQA